MDGLETLSRLSSMYGRINALTDDDKKMIETLYPELLAKPFIKRMGCADCYKDALIELQLKIKNSGMEKPKYSLKNGVVLYIHETKQHYTNANLTNKIAADYLKKHPDDAKFFAQLPTEDAEIEVDESKDVDSDKESQLPTEDAEKRGRKRK